MVNGLGNNVPPLREHVIIYFLQKGTSENVATSFYDYFNARRWRNQRNKKVQNWKVAAWNWILETLYPD